MTMQSAAEIIVGTVVHERLRPCLHRFHYPVFCLRLNLARLDELQGRWFGIDRWRPLSLRTADHGARDGGDLLAWIRQLLHSAGRPHDGAAVHLQTFPRVFGHGFNPVSFWHCHDAQGALRSVLAEVNNTFGEHHLYLLHTSDGTAITAHSELQCRKVFHVSPFCPVEGHYRFRFRDSGSTRFASIHYHDAQGLLMRTSIGGRCLPFTATNLRRCLLRQPLLTLGVVARIHWQALRLWLRKVPFLRKPAPPAQLLSQTETIATAPSKELP
jgi:DUF1365 family protein